MNFIWYFIVFLASNAIIEGVPPDRWKQCESNGNGTIKMDKKIKEQLFCYNSQLTADFGWKGAKRLKMRQMGKELAAKCAGNDGKKGWNALLIKQNEENGEKAFTFQSSFGKNLTGKLDNEFVINGKDFFAINLTKAFGISDSDLFKFQNALPFGAFLMDFDNVALHIVALELRRAVEANDVKMCKTQPKPIKPEAKNVDHFGINCVQIVFPEDIGQFWLNITASLYGRACHPYQRTYEIGKFPKNFSEVGKQDMVDACANVPTSFNCSKTSKLIVCYKSKNQSLIVNEEIADICRQHLGKAQHFVAGFRIRICARREANAQLIIVKTILDFSFTDQMYAIERNFSFKIETIMETQQRIPFFFIEFGNGNDQNALRGKTDGEEISEDSNKKMNSIGAILDSIVEEEINGSWAKSLHFVPPSDAYIKIFFQIPSPNFSRLISRKKDLKFYHHAPNKTKTSRCDLLGPDCEPTRDLLRKIQQILICCSPKNPSGPCICTHPSSDPNEFKVPPPSAGQQTLSTKESATQTIFGHRKKDDDDPLNGGDIFYEKEDAQRRYDELKKACAQCYPSLNEEQRVKRQAGFFMIKWTKFPIAIRFDNDLGENPLAWIGAINSGTEMIMRETCINFTTDLSHEPNEGINIIDEGGNGSPVGKKTGWQDLSLHWTDGGVAGHELLHALGLEHEQNRDDAPNFLKLNPKERTKEWINNYEPSFKTNNYGFPYDFGSILHYFATIHDGFYDIITMNRFYQHTIGRVAGATKISFKDTAIINHIYCKDVCNAVENKCQNGGYPNPRQCAECLCPEGYGGKYCESLAENEHCADNEFPREIEADWIRRELKPKLICAGSAPSCSCHWRIKPKDGKKVMINLKKLNESALSCGNPCGPHRVELKYRKDRRARGAWLCCSNQLKEENNQSPNLIQADEPGLDIVISVHIKSSTFAMEPFELTYETDGPKLVSSNNCIEGVNYKEARNPGSGLYCIDPKTGEGVPCCPEGQKCESLRSDASWLCDVVVLNGQYREVRGKNESHTFYFECLRREDDTKQFWAYRKDRSKEPIRIDELQCLNYWEVGIETPPNKTEITNPMRFKSAKIDGTN